jgi:hypothetical protein
MHVFLFAIMMAVLGVSGIASAGEEVAPKPEKAKFRLGVFDSRAVAVAYAHSKIGQEKIGQEIQGLKKELDAAEAAGDKAKADEIRAEGKAGQERLHQQGFGTASVKKYLDPVKDKIPQVAKDAGVDVIVSKWDLTYQNPAVETVDVTDEVVKLFEPSERVVKMVQEMKKHPPMDEDDVRKIKD